MLPFSLSRFFGDGTGPNLLILGGVHGNEVCGSQAIQQVMQELQNGLLRLAAGSVTFIPIVNAKAYGAQSRGGERDLNREFKRYTNPVLFEDRVTNFLANIMAECDVLLDLHSFSASGEGFVFVGPEDNTTAVEPFAKAAQELQFAQSLGLRKMVYGWLSTYHCFVEEQHAFIATGQAGNADIPATHADFGVGTTEYFRSLGKYGVTVECGNHIAPESVAVGHQVIRNALAYLGIAEQPPILPKPFAESYRFAQIIIRHHEQDTFPRKWQSFAPVAKGEPLGIRATGEVLVAPAEGVVIFSYEDAAVGTEWLYYAACSIRGTIGLA